MTNEKNIKESFSKVKEDVTFLKREINSFNQSIIL